MSMLGARKPKKSQTKASLAPFTVRSYLNSMLGHSGSQTPVVARLKSKLLRDASQTVAIIPESLGFWDAAFMDRRTIDPFHDLQKSVSLLWCSHSNFLSKSKDGLSSRDVQHPERFSIKAVTMSMFSAFYSKFRKIFQAGIDQCTIGIPNNQAIRRMWSSVASYVSISKSNGTFAIKESAQPSGHVFFAFSHAMNIAQGIHL